MRSGVRDDDGIAQILLLKPEKQVRPGKVDYMFRNVLCAIAALCLPAAAGARAAEASFAVEGTGFRIRKFTDGATACGNRKYVWRSVPKRLDGWLFTQLDGGARSKLTVRAGADGVLHVATATGQPGVDLTGWEEADGLRFHYTDKGKTAMAVFRKTVKVGQKVQIPQGNWTGTIVLAPSLTGEAAGPGAPQAPRAPDHSRAPGVVIDHIPARTGKYVGSPSIAVLPNGQYVASHDVFGRKSRQRITRVFGSADRGATWRHLTDIDGQWWSTLFMHRGALYVMGVSRRFGHVVIRRSTDGGTTWTTPKDKNTGLLLADGKYHCAPVPVVVHDGRLWRAMEDAMGPGGWGSSFRSFMMSAPVDADLLKAESWTFSNRLGRSPTWLSGKFGGWLEGNAVVTPAGRIVNILRADSPGGGKAAIVSISKDGRQATFNPKDGFIDFPGGAKKFTIRCDPKTKLYWSLVNHIQNKDRGKHPKGSLIRNTLAMISSPDLRNWTVKSIVLHHEDVAKHGFQYVDWLFEGEDLIAVSRTAYDDGLGGAHSQHDANYLTFHRIRNFRQRTMKDPPLGGGVPAPGGPKSKPASAGRG